MSSERYWHPRLKMFVTDGDAPAPPVRLERSYAGPVEEAEAYQTPAEEWNGILRAIAEVRGVEVPQELLKRDPFEEKRVLKVQYWLRRLENGELEITEEFLDALEHRDPRSAKFLRRLIAAHEALLGHEESEQE